MSDFSHSLDLFVLAHFWLVFTPILAGAVAVAVGILRASGRAWNRSILNAISTAPGMKSPGRRSVSRHPDFTVIPTAGTYGNRAGKTDHYNRSETPNPAYLARFETGESDYARRMREDYKNREAWLKTPAGIEYLRQSRIYDDAIEAERIEAEACDDSSADCRKPGCFHSE